MIRASAVMYPRCAKTPAERFLPHRRGVCLRCRRRLLGIATEGGGRGLGGAQPGRVGQKFGNPPPLVIMAWVGESAVQDPPFDVSVGAPL